MHLYVVHIAWEPAGYINIKEYAPLVAVQRLAPPASPTMPALIITHCDAEALDYIQTKLPR
jgi:hypothetical protein